MGKELAVKVGKVVLANVIGYFIWKGIKNKLDGRTIFGNDKEKLNEETRVDWRGNIVLGSNDGWVV